MTPFIPSSCVRAVLVDKFISRQAVSLLEELNIAVIKTVPIQEIGDSTSTHPDMQLTPIGDRAALVCDRVLDRYSRLLPDFRLIPIRGIRSPYPNDCMINITPVDDKCFLTEHQKTLSEHLGGYKLITVKQGYTKCNICILNSEAIITSDISIASAASENGIRVYQLPDSQILLSGYSHGFWGGACGLIDKNRLFFSGDISRLECADELFSVLKKEKIEPIFPKNIPLSDNGSIIPLY